jgi:hypothetical protein
MGEVESSSFPKGRPSLVVSEASSRYALIPHATATDGTSFHLLATAKPGASGVQATTL